MKDWFDSIRFDSMTDWFDSIRFDSIRWPIIFSNFVKQRIIMWYFLTQKSVLENRFSQTRFRFVDRLIHSTSSTHSMTDSINSTRFFISFDDRYNISWWCIEWYLFNLLCDRYYYYDTTNIARLLVPRGRPTHDDARTFRGAFYLCYHQRTTRMYAAHGKLILFNCFHDDVGKGFVYSYVVYSTYYSMCRLVLGVFKKCCDWQCGL
jgi:hypothetical protein